MAVWNNKTIYWVTALVLAFMVVVVVLAGCKKEPSEPATAESSAAGAPSAAKAGDAGTGAVEAAKNLFGDSKTSLQKAIDEAKTWEPTFDEWRGKIAPDFTLTDIEGNVHTLSSYRGKNVVVVFWATWCGPCKLEVPELIELRNSIGPDNLAILAISSREGVDLVKNFAAQNNVNYTMLSGAGTNLPSPYADIRAIPSSFFIDPEGRIKLATRGMLARADVNKILDAK